jgi:hypothetical protein
VEIPQTKKISIEDCINYNTNLNTNINFNLDNIKLQSRNNSVSLKHKIDINENENEYNNINHPCKKYISVRHLDNTKLNLYYLFKATYPDIKISKSTFYANIPYYFKKASKKTDLCPICEVNIIFIIYYKF